jgi:hypothetical protein
VVLQLCSNVRTLEVPGSRRTFRGADAAPRQSVRMMSAAGVLTDAPRDALRQ